MTVSGFTISSAERHADHNRDNQTQRHRSTDFRASRLVFGFRWSTVNWWRKAMFSACNAAWPRRPVRREMSVINIRSSTAEAAYPRFDANPTIHVPMRFSGRTIAKQRDFSFLDTTRRQLLPEHEFARNRPYIKASEVLSQRSGASCGSPERPGC
jgi:hypothetical protein